MERVVMKLSPTYYQQNGALQQDGYPLEVALYVSMELQWGLLLLTQKQKPSLGMAYQDLVILVDLVKEMALHYL